MQSQHTTKGSVYFVQPGDIKKVKIGFCAGQVSDRIASLQTGSCEVLKVLCEIPNASMQMERGLHAKFQEYRLHREWFTLSREIIEFIQHPVKLSAHDARGNWLGIYSDAESVKEAIHRAALEHEIESINYEPNKRNTIFRARARAWMNLNLEATP